MDCAGPAELELEAVLPPDADLDAVLAEDLDEESPARAGSPMMMAEARADGFLLHSLQ